MATLMTDETDSSDNSANSENSSNPDNSDDSENSAVMILKILMTLTTLGIISATKNKIPILRLLSHTKAFMDYFFKKEFHDEIWHFGRLCNVTQLLSL